MVRRVRDFDPRVGWALSLAVMATGFLLAMPARGWLDVVAGVMLFGGMLASWGFAILNSRRVPKDQRSWSWWGDWNKR